MTQSEYLKNPQILKNLSTPDQCVDVILDTDTYNEVDDQYAISYMLRSPERIHVKGICAAPFSMNGKSVSAEDGMQKSYDEIFHILKLAGRTDLNEHVYRGSENYLPDEETPVPSEAADFMANLADDYSMENPLYIVAIGAITNVASALLKNPAMIEKTVVIWLGGHALHMPQTDEYNMKQDVAGARVLFGCGVPLVQLPCFGVVDTFSTSRYELEHWLRGKNPLCDYLLNITISEAESYAAGKPWTRVIWDVTAVAWLLNDNSRFMQDTLIASPIPEYDHHYAQDPTRHFIKYVYHIDRDALFEDLFQKLGGES